MTNPISYNSALKRWIVRGRDGTVSYYARIVMAAHLGRMLTRDELVHHKNGDSTDDRLSNLEITTRRQHLKKHLPELLAAQRPLRGDSHYSRIEPHRLARGERHGMATLSDLEVEALRQRYSEGGITDTVLAKEYNVSRSTVYRLVRHWSRP